MADEDIKLIGREAARHALLNEHRGKTFSRETLNKSGVACGRQFNKHLAQCNRELGRTFGMELIEVRARGLDQVQMALDAKMKLKALKESQRQKNGNQGDDQAPVDLKPKAGSSGKQYILRSCLSPELIYKLGEIVDEEIPRDDREDNWLKEENDVLDWKRGDEVAYHGVLGLILALILTHGRTMDNHELRNYLKRLRVDEKWSPPHTPACMHPQPDLDRLLDHFVKYKYLECSERSGKLAGSQAGASRRQSQGVRNEANNQKQEWRWGARAEIEFGEKGIAKFITDIFKEACPQNRAPAQSGSALDRGSAFSVQKLMSDIAKAAGGELQDADRLESSLGDAAV
ncbi:MAGE family-domain-containing protein [Melampsora americana]|nr:MAGE family-domain-containing protein [Melampsora americana]